TATAPAGHAVGRVGTRRSLRRLGTWAGLPDLPWEGTPGGPALRGRHRRQPQPPREVGPVTSDSDLGGRLSPQLLPRPGPPRGPVGVRPRSGPAQSPARTACSLLARRVHPRVAYSRDPLLTQDDPQAASLAAPGGRPGGTRSDPGVGRLVRRAPTLG